MSLDQHRRETQRGLREFSLSALSSTKLCPLHICTVTSESGTLDKSLYVTDVQEDLVAPDSTDRARAAAGRAQRSQSSRK